MLKSYVVAIITEISNILTLRAKGRQTDSFKRIITIQNERSCLPLF